MASLFTSLAGPLIGGLLGGSGNKQESSSKQTIDPRMDPYIYGSGGSLPAAADWFAKNKSGMNAQMQQGLNNQSAQYAASKPGFDQMQNLGLGLMGGGVAGNPFSQGYSGGTNFAPMGRSNTAGQNQPQAMQTTSAYQPAIFDAAPVQQAPTQAPAQSSPMDGIDPVLWQWMQEQARSKKSEQDQFRANPGFEMR